MGGCSHLYQGMNVFNYFRVRPKNTKYEIVLFGRVTAFVASMPLSPDGIPRDRKVLTLQRIREADPRKQGRAGARPSQTTQTQI